MSICRRVKQLIYAVCGQMCSSHGRLQSHVRKEHLSFMWCTFVNTWEMQIANTYKRKVTAVASALTNKDYWEDSGERQAIGHRRDKQYQVKKPFYP